ncbi:MAG: Plug domain-containing protein [Parasphingorhabdus sp.]
MKRMQIAISLLLAGTTAQVHAREPALQDIPISVSVFNADDVENMGAQDIRDNLDRLVDINQACAVNGGDPIFGQNAAGGAINPVNIRGLTNEYGTRYGAAITTIATRNLDVLALKQLELLPGPNVFTCSDKSLVTPTDSTLPAVAEPANPSLTFPTPSTDPSLAVQPLPPEVQSGRYLPRASDVRAELDGIVNLCQNATEEEGAIYKERYRQRFNQLRELRAIQSDLRERLLTNDPTLNTEDALNQLRKLDPAIDGAVFPSQLKCPPTAGEKIRYQADPVAFYDDYSSDVAVAYFDGLFDDVGRVSERLRFVSRSDEKYELEDASRAGGFEPNFNFFGSTSLGQTDLGNTQTGIGFKSTGPGTETFAGTAPDRVDSFSVGGTLSAKVSDTITISGYYSYSEGDARSDFDIPAGGSIDVGNVYGGFSPSGSTGLNIGNRGLSGFNESDLSLHELKFSATHPLATEGPFTSSATLFINALFMDRNYRSETNANVFGTPITQRRDQKVKDSLIGLGGILNGRLQMADGVAATGSFASGIYYRDTDMRSLELNDCGLCPPADQNFSLNFEESDSGVSFAGTIAAGLEFDVTSTMKFTIGADAGYATDLGEIFNPSSGDQVLAGETTRLGKTNVWRWRGSIGLGLDF